MFNTWEQTEFRVALCFQYGNPSFREPSQRSNINSTAFCHLIISISLIWSVTEPQTIEDYIYPCHSQSTWSSWDPDLLSFPSQSCILLPLFCIFRKQRSGSSRHFIIKAWAVPRGAGVDKSKTRRKLISSFFREEGQKAEVQNLKASSTSTSSSHEETPPWISDSGTLQKHNLYLKLTMVVDRSNDLVGKGACLQTQQPEFDTRTHMVRREPTGASCPHTFAFSTWAFLHFSTRTWDTNKRTHSLCLCLFVSLPSSLPPSFSLSPSKNKYK